MANKRSELGASAPAEPPPDEALTSLAEARFRRLVRAWHEATDDASVAEAIVADKNYLQVISMGQAAVPLILKELRANGGLWHPALESITCEEPETPAERQSKAGMRTAWLRWGEEHGHFR